MKFLTRASSSDGDWKANCDYVLLDVDEVLAATILGRAAVFEELKKREGVFSGSDLLELVFWHRGATFLSAEAVPCALSDEVDLRDFIVVADDWDPGEGERMECEQLIVDERGVRLTAIPKHSDIYISSEALPWASIKAIRDVASPPAGPSLEPTPA